MIESMKKWCIVTISQSLFCLAVRPEALLVSRVIVTHRNPVELSGDRKYEKVVYRYDQSIAILLSRPPRSVAGE